jgi:hypothetical protein
VAIPQELKGEFTTHTRSVVIPQELQDCFMTLTQEVYPDFSTLSLSRGIDAALLYFNRVTKTTDQLVQSDIRYLIAIIDTMKTAWMLRTVKASQEFQIAARYRSANAFEQQMDQWGMTIERFFDKFEEVIPSINERARETTYFLLYYIGNIRSIQASSRSSPTTPANA